MNEKATHETATRETVTQAAPKSAQVAPAPKSAIAIVKTVPAKNNEYIAAVLIRGLIGTRATVRDTLYMLRLRKKHTCVVMKNTPHNIGMLKKAKDFITFGPISDATIAALKQARKTTDADKGIMSFHLSPPKGGFERKGIKKTMVQGGALGLRKEIDTLIKKMM